jgi:CTP synthase (UTP-ammonia lyase)
MDRLKIAIIGDYNFTFNAHHATNLALDHASIFLDLEMSYYWIRIQEVAQQKVAFFDTYDAFWIAPGPYLNPFFLQGIFSRLTQLNKPVLVTGEAYKLFLEFLITKQGMNAAGEKLISDNLVTGSYFESISIVPKSKGFRKLYEHFTTNELSAVRYSLYPNLVLDLVSNNIEIEAVNQFEDPEALSIKTHLFFLVMSYYPQVSSTRDLPHPVVYTFIKAALSHQQDTHSPD